MTTQIGSTPGRLTRGPPEGQRAACAIGRVPRRVYPRRPGGIFKSSHPEGDPQDAGSWNKDGGIENAGQRNDGSACTARVSDRHLPVCYKSPEPRMSESFPDDPKPWQVLSSTYLHRKPWLTLRQDRVRLPGGGVIEEYF